ncbi:MAG: hypothetical protein ACRC9V_13500 [Aeromonas sp.]
MPQVKLAQLVLKPAHLSELQTLLAHHVPTAEVWAYGSRVIPSSPEPCSPEPCSPEPRSPEPRSHEGSDLDLVLRNPTQLQQPVDGMAELNEALQQSRLPMLVDVHQWSHLPPAFHEEIARAYIVLYTPASLTNMEELEDGE